MFLTQNNDSTTNIYIEYCDREIDEAVALDLFKVLKDYKIPKRLNISSKNHRLGTIYLHKSSLSDRGESQAAISDNLEQAGFLIIICSPATPQSSTTLKIIDHFKNNGNEENILLLLVEGEPEESFPKSVRKINRKEWSDLFGTYIQTEKDIEPIAADVRSASIKSSLQLLKIEKFRIIGSILGCSFDGLRQRYKERTVLRITYFMVTSVTVCLIFFIAGFALWRYSENESEKLQKEINDTASSETIAQQQAEIARANMNHLQIDLPAQLANNPDAYQVINNSIQALNERETLESNRGEVNVTLWGRFCSMLKDISKNPFLRNSIHLAPKLIAWVGDEIDDLFHTVAKMRNIDDIISAFKSLLDDLGKLLLALIAAIACFFKWLSLKWNSSEARRFFKNSKK